MVKGNIQSHLGYSDAAFIKRFEDLSLDPQLFSHEAHLRLAYIYLLIYSPAKAMSKVRKGIQKFDKTFSQGEKYHETITTALVEIISDRVQKGNAESWEAFIKNNSDLLHFKKLMANYYSLGIFDSDKARLTFVKPDIKPLPGCTNKRLHISLASLLISIIFLLGCGHSSDEHYSTGHNSTATQHSTDPHHTEQNTSTSSAVRVSQSATITLNGPLKEVFPLFSPELEKKWAEGWDFEKIFFETESGEEYSIFQTKTHHQGESKTTWIISKRDTINNPRIIEYITFNPHWVTIINIKCYSEKNEQSKTKTVIAYTYTSLTDFGSQKIPEVLKKMYGNNMKDWEEAINYYLLKAH